jgi:hypothetical protein
MSNCLRAAFQPNEEGQMNDELLQRVAAVAHDCWVAQMRSDGWSYGPSCDSLAEQSSRNNGEDVPATVS